jgi:BirA family biotin operon repressor/biotin-[acetyl-CoA-carboxylase] ligase
MPFPVLRYEALGSTNTEALEQARQGVASPVWIVARAQTAGRGRQGRVWSSPPGNLYATLLTVDPAPARRLPELGFVAGVALARTLRGLVGGDSRLRIKWPNDILFDGAKLAGLLLEGARLADGRFACAIGIGVNCGSFPADTPYRATSLAEVGTVLAVPEVVLDSLSHEIAHWLAVWNRGTNFEAVRAAWLAMAAAVGDPIKLAMNDRTLEGVFKTIDAGGRLVLETAARTVTIEAGDVFILPMPAGGRAALTAGA